MFELPAELIKHFDTQRLRHLFAGDFDSSDVTVMPDARLAEAQRAHDFFALIDHAQLFNSDGRAIRDT